MLSPFQELQTIVTSKKNILYIPGFNQAPDILDNFCDKNQIHTFNLPYNTYSLVDLKDYSLSNAIDDLNRHLQSNKYETMFAHSLGALILLLCHRDQLVNKDIYLISPAFKGKRIGNIFRYLFDNLLIPSFNRVKYRNNSFCYTKHYKEILELQKTIDISRLKTLNCTVVYSRYDEMIDVDYVKNLYGAVEFQTRFYPRHLCLDFINTIL